MNTRVELEKAILSPIIFCNGYAYIANILTEKNFVTEPHKIIFSICTELYPVKPIDIIVLTHVLRERYPDNVQLIHYAFVELSHISANTHLVYHSFLLLQEDIKLKFLSSVTAWKVNREKELQHTQAATLLE